MRFLILVTAAGDTGAGTPPPASLVAAIDGYHATLARAGVLLDASALEGSATGFRIRYHEGRRSVVGGPFAGGGLVAGYALIQVKSKEEALEWARRFPAPHGEAEAAEIEVRPLLGPEGPGA
jgi:hypothetical protein